MALDGAVEKFANQLAPLFALGGNAVGGGVVWIVAYTTGVYLLIRAAYKIKEHNDNPQHHPLSSAIVTFFIAALCIGMPTALDMVRETVGLSTSLGALGYAKPGSVSTGVEAAIYVYVAFFGYIGFFRGLLIWNKGGEAGKRGDEFGRGLTHVIGGVMATNLAEIVAALKSLFL